MKVRLVTYKGDDVDLAFSLPESGASIGREPGNLIQLPDPKVSKQHAFVGMSGGGWTIEDLRSTNGTLVNGARVKTARLKVGDRVGIGPFELVFQTHVDGEDWLPSHVIDLSSRAVQRTLS